MTSTPGADDEQLMLALQSGDDLALNALMAHWQIPLRSFLYRYTLNEHDAADLAQESFVRVYQHRARFDPAKKFSTWLFAIALNLARSRARWQRRHFTESLDTAPEPSAGGSPQSDAVATEQACAVRAAIAELPADLREAVLLFEYEEKSHAEIGVIVGASPKAVETRLYRARQLLKKTLGRYLA